MAIDIANDTNFGLGASVFTQDIERGKRVGGELEVGSLFINENVVTDPSLTGGGIKESGSGRECYIDGLVEISNKKIVTIGKKWILTH